MLEDKLYSSPLRAKDVDPKNKEQVKQYFREQIDHAIALENSSNSPFNHPLVQRTHKE